MFKTLPQTIFWIFLFGCVHYYYMDIRADSWMLGAISGLVVGNIYNHKEE